MKRIVFIIVFMLVFSPAYALKNPFSSCPEIPAPEAPKKCYHSIKLTPTMEYIFIGGCETVVQIGVIFTGKRKILFLDESQRITSFSEFTGPNGLTDARMKNFPDAKEVEFKIFMESDY